MNSSRYAALFCYNLVFLVSNMTLRSVNSYLLENLQKTGFPAFDRQSLVCDQNAADPPTIAG